MKRTWLAAGWRLVLAGLGLWLAGCGPAVTPVVLPTSAGGETPSAPAAASATAPASTPEPTLTPTPTSTPEPLAAEVNGEGIPLAEVEAEVARCQQGLAAAGQDAAVCPERALQALIEQRVVEQAAAAAGITALPDEVDAEMARISDARLAEAAAEAGGGSLADWLAQNGYTEASFREALRREILRSKMAEQVMAQVGETAEQAHARLILVADETQANDLLSKARAGADFATLALENSLDASSRAAGGDLGWFPRGWLTVPEVEQAAFSLAPGEISDVLPSELGYCIVQALEIDPARPLSPGAREALRAAAYQSWLEGLLAQAAIQKFNSP
jgi:peptidyl-prolyl cis-trans isomerase C